MILKENDKFTALKFFWQNYISLVMLWNNNWLNNIDSSVSVLSDTNSFSVRNKEQQRGMVYERETRAREHARQHGWFLSRARECIDINECYMRSRRCIEPHEHTTGYAMRNAIKRLAGAR